MSVGAATLDAGFVIGRVCGREIDDDGFAQHDADERAPLPLERAELERCRSGLRDESRRDDKGCQRALLQAPTS